MPGGFENPDIQHFYDFAAGNSLYRSGAYVTKDVQEFFAVTASLYLGEMSIDRRSIAII